MITVEISGDSQIIAKLESFTPRLQVNLVKKMRLAMIYLAGYVKSEKLSGQVLNVRTGTLRRSITQQVTDEAESITGIVGANIKYAAIHEYGFQGTEQVKEHIRHSSTGKAAVVRAFSRRVNMPERSFLRSSLTDTTDKITEYLQQAVTDTANDK